MAPCKCVNPLSHPYMTVDYEKGLNNVTYLLLGVDKSDENTNQQHAVSRSRHCKQVFAMMYLKTL